MRKYLLIVMLLSYGVCMSQKNNEQIQTSNNDTNENTEQKYEFSKNVGFFTVKYIEDGKTKTALSSATYVKDGYGFTTAHSINNMNETLFVNFNGKIIKAHPVMKFTQDNFDSVLLKFAEIPVNAKELDYADKVCTNETFYLHGFPKGIKEVRKSKLLHLDTKGDTLIMTKAIEPGMSGGLCLNKNGQIIGIMTAYGNQKEIENAKYCKENNITENEFSVVISSDHIFYFIEKLKKNTQP